ncbi:hypothetical protein [Vibrio zhanjiangensis]|nr:hypothetical protein [Vibrio zhanjiangensis]
MMKKHFLAIGLAMLSVHTQAGVSQIVGAKIQNIEFYGSQFTVTLDKTYSSIGCGHPGKNVVAMDSSTEPGKTHYSALLAVWMGGKSVNMRITDETCSGDRPTLLSWAAN